METLKIENLGNTQSTTRTLKLNETESLHGGLPASGTFGPDGRVVNTATNRFTGEVIGRPNANGDRGVFAGGQAVALVRANGTVVRGGRDTGFDVFSTSGGPITGDTVTVNGRETVGFISFNG